ncbi:metacaspase-like protein [Plasmodium berghei]|uniref:Metacaspase-3, putative n=2 Tax=Plasmodium berghei TaxID=5821 RepID=A0A509ANH5_PLABA|nr:metacaspase-3, putative [Plasmodium berghei ANKA]CXI54301.1 metacaspase-like protein [Plasmodium berghei]SCL94948.1 metacaspase-like protein [Plasmodium berghei]SCM16140.1 metacaspase-like protein [Plasmodium berghei]SCN26299.1 metacaspase-like protein [Plasmodium berghei]VUC56262.1 metacaspase-3, putative [Plasmodium berghei ANKA]|eukprot:XP_034422064.1 metacaspase-3, putative [Plasmodium berghei ANKA]
MAYYDYKNSIDKKKKIFPLKDFVDLYEIKNNIKLDKYEPSENCTCSIEIMKKKNKIVSNTKKNRKNENYPDIAKSVSSKVKVYNDIYKTVTKGYSTDYNNDEYMKKNCKDNKFNFSKSIANLNKNKTTPINLFSNIQEKNNNGVNKINTYYHENSKKEKKKKINYDNIINEGNNNIEKLMKNFKNSKRNTNLLSIYLDNCKYDINNNNGKQIKYKKIMNAASEIGKTDTKIKNIYDNKFLQNEKLEYDKNKVNSDIFYQYNKHENCNTNRNELKNNSLDVLKQIDKTENAPNTFWKHNLGNKINDKDNLFNKSDVNKNKYSNFQNEERIFPYFLKGYETESIKMCDNISNSSMIYLKNKSDIYVKKNKNIYINNNIEKEHPNYVKDINIGNISSDAFEKKNNTIRFISSNNSQKIKDFHNSISKNNVKTVPFFMSKMEKNDIKPECKDNIIGEFKCKSDNSILEYTTFNNESNKVKVLNKEIQNENYDIKSHTNANNNENSHCSYLECNRHRGNRIFTDVIPQIKLKNNFIQNKNVEIEINKHNHSNYNNKYEDNNSKNLDDNKMYLFPKKNNNFHRMIEGNIKNKLETNYHIRDEENYVNIFEKKEDEIYNDYIMEKKNEIHSEQGFNNLRCYINEYNNDVYVVKKNEFSKIIDGNLCENGKNIPFEYALSEITEFNQNENKDVSKLEEFNSDTKTHIFSKNEKKCKNGHFIFNGNDDNKERVDKVSPEFYRQDGNINENCNKIKSFNISNISLNCLFKEGKNKHNVISTNPRFQIGEIKNILNSQNEVINLREHILDKNYTNNTNDLKYKICLNKEFIDKNHKIKTTNYYNEYKTCYNTVESTIPSYLSLSDIENEEKENIDEHNNEYIKDEMKGQKIKCFMSNNNNSINYTNKYLNNGNIYLGTNVYKQCDNNIKTGEYSARNRNNNNIYQKQYGQINLNNINKEKLTFSNTFFQNISKDNRENNYMKKSEINNNNASFQNYKIHNLMKLNTAHIPVLKNNISKKNSDIIPIVKLEKAIKTDISTLPFSSYNNNNKGNVKQLYSSKTIVGLSNINKENGSTSSNASKATLAFPNLLLHKNNILNNHQSITKLRSNTTLNNCKNYEMMQKNITPKTTSMSYDNIKYKNKMFKISGFYNKPTQNITKTIKDREGSKSVLSNKVLYNKVKCDDNILVNKKLSVCKSINNSDIYNYLKNTHINSLKNYYRTTSYRKQSLKNVKSITKNIKLVPKGNDIISMNHEKKNKIMNNTIDLHKFYSRCEIESIDRIKKAVVIGCNYMGEKDSINRLHGSVNDAYVFSRVLVKYFNFLPENILLLIDSFPSNAYIYDDFDINRTKYINEKINYTYNEEKIEKKNLFNLFNKKNIHDNKEVSNDYENNNSCVDVDIKNVDLSFKNIDFSLWPTRINILKAVNWLVRDSVPNGSYVFYYAGKSIQVDNMSGWEGEGYDEAFLCSDPLNKNEEHNILTAIQLKDLLLSINSTAQMTIILDTSGGQTILDPAGTENSSYIKGCKQKGIWPITNPTNKVYKAIYDITILDNNSMKKYMCKPRYSKLIEVDSTSAMIDPLLQSISSFPIPTKAYCLCAATWEQISIEGLFPIFEFARVDQKKKKKTFSKPIEHKNDNNNMNGNRENIENNSQHMLDNSIHSNSVKKNIYEPNISFNINSLTKFFTLNNKNTEDNDSEIVKAEENTFTNKISDNFEENNNGKYSIIKDNNEYNSNKFDGNNNYVLVCHGVFTYCLIESIMEFKKKELNNNVFEKEFQQCAPMTLNNLISHIQKKIQIIKNNKLKKLNQKPELTIHPGANASINNYFIHYSKNINFQDFKYFYMNEDMSPFLNVNKAWEEINKRTLRNRKLLYATSTLVNTSSKYFTQTNHKIKNSCSLKY